MAEITVDVWLYGPLAQYGGPGSDGAFANVPVRMAPGATMADLLAQLGIPGNERGITFMDGQLSAMPGLQPDLGHPLSDGMRVGIFGPKSMWPFQYRHGASMLPELSEALGDRDLHHNHG